MSRRRQFRRKTATTLDAATVDSFQNFVLSVGRGTDTAFSGDTYGFEPITRNRTLVEWMYRGSWLAGVGVDAIAEDMTRAGIELALDWEPHEIEEIDRDFNVFNVWGGVAQTIKWGRLYGGAVGVLLIDGQDLETPLRLETVGPKQFRGILPIDRWQLDVNPGDVIEDYGPDMGKPVFYSSIGAIPGYPKGRIHHSRILRVVGDELPYQQANMENLWGMSIFERVFDRITAFDRATLGAAQLTAKLHNRTFQIEGYRQILAAGGRPLQALMRQLDEMRRTMSNEGITVIDAKDNLIAATHNVNTGITDTLVQLGQQISGAWQIPLVRLFGQSPTGLNSSGEADMRTYYDGIARRQNYELRGFMTKVVRCIAASRQRELPENWDFKFRPLWQMNETEKASTAGTDTQTVLSALESGIIQPETALMELSQMGKHTGRWTNITREEIEAAKNVPPPAAGPAMEQVRAQQPPTAGPRELQPPAARAADSGSVFKRVWRRVRGHARDDTPGRLRMDFQGLPVVIECQRGESRWQGGPPWPCDYGYIRGTKSAEGEHEQTDCFIGPDENARDAYVINHYDRAGRFEEHKVMLGFTGRRDALAAYNMGYNMDQHRAKTIPMEQLVKWLCTADVRKPV